MIKKQPSWASGTSRSKPNRGSVLETMKAEVTTKANELIETDLKLQYIRASSEDPQFNYIIDICGKWYKEHIFYFYAIYRIAYSYIDKSIFYLKCARIEYDGNNLFRLSFSRHTGQ